MFGYKEISKERNENFNKKKVYKSLVIKIGFLFNFFKIHIDQNNFLQGVKAINVVQGDTI